MTFCLFSILYFGWAFFCGWLGGWAVVDASYPAWSSGDGDGDGGRAESIVVGGLGVVTSLFDSVLEWDGKDLGCHVVSGCFETWLQYTDKISAATAFQCVHVILLSAPHQDPIELLCLIILGSMYHRSLLPLPLLLLFLPPLSSSSLLSVQRKEMQGAAN